MTFIRIYQNPAKLVQVHKILDGLHNLRASHCRVNHWYMQLIYKAKRLSELASSDSLNDLLISRSDIFTEC